MTTPTPSAAEAAQSGVSRFLSAFGDVWRQEVFGVETGLLVLAGLVMALAWVLRGVVAHWLMDIARQATKKTVTKFDDELLDAFEGPASLAPLALGFFVAIELLSLEGVARETAFRIETSLIAVMLFWALYRAVDPVVGLLDPVSGALDQSLIDWLRKAAKFFFGFVGAASVLEIWGIPVGPILAGLGIFGVAVALGAQDLFQNLIAGLSILIEQRFRRGDWIKVDGVVEGTVERINFRSTTVRRFDKSPVYVPNSKLSDNAVTNFSRMTHRRIYWKITLEYGSTSEQLRYVCDKLHEYVMGNPEFAKPPEVSTFVFVDSFNDSSIDLMLYCFTKTTNWGEWLAIKHELAIALKEMVEAAGTGFAFPSQTSYLVDMDKLEAPANPRIVAEHKPRMWGHDSDARGEASD